MFLFIICIFIILLLFFLYRIEIFGISDSLTNEEYLNLGYGYYDIPQQTECINQTNKCSEKGIISEIQVCIPNEKTKNGCIKKGSIQTFESKISEKNCISSCRYSIWGKTHISECFLDNNDICFFNNKGFKILEKKCIQNDAYGMNTCSYDLNTNSKIFDGCVLNSNGYTVECNVGSIYKEIQTCNNPVNLDTLEELKHCGSWKVDKDAYKKDENIAKNFNDDCLNPNNEINKTSYCYNFQDGNILNNNNIIGFTKIPFYCDNDVCSKNYNCIDETTLNGRIQIYNNMKNNISTVICNNGISPICVKLCSL